MPKLLTDDDSTFTPNNVQVPVGGDARTAASVEVGFQELANRTAYLKTNQDDTQQKRLYYLASFDGSPAPSGLFTVPATSPQFTAVNLGGFSVSSSAIQVPEAGIYLVTVSLGARLASGDNNDIFKVGIAVGGTTKLLQHCQRNGVDTLERFSLSVIGPVDIATPATQKITIVNAHDVTINDAIGHISVHKCGPAA